MKDVVKYSMNFSLFAYMLMGISGYISFIDKTPGNILKGFDVTNPNMSFTMVILAFAAYVGMALSLTATFPLMLFPMRYSILCLFYDNEYIDKQYENMSLKFKILHYTVSLSIDLCILII